MRMTLRRILSVCSILVVAPLVAYGQIFPEELVRPLTLSLTPEYPEAHTNVRIRAQTYSIDLDRSLVVWYVNGSEVAKGEGLREATITTGELGSETIVNVVAQEESGLIAEGTATIRPTEVDLLWEALSYVPPFYAGRALPGSNTTIRAQAVARLRGADGSLVPESDIVYSWYRNGTLLPVSGRGKSRISITGPALFGTDTLSVIAESADKTLRGRAQAALTSHDPHVELYVKHPLFGILFNRALSTNTVHAESEETVVAMPYFANITSPAQSSLLYEWTVNNKEIPAHPETPHILTISAGNYTGPATIELLLTSAADLLMQSRGEWNIVFGGGSASLFGGGAQSTTLFGDGNE